MERLTVNDLNKVCYDPWELCGMESYCTKGCHEEGGCAKGCEVLKIYRKLAEYEDLEEQGKLLKLPVLVGGTVWNNDFGHPCSYTVTGFSFGKIDDDEENDIEGLQMYYRNYNGSIRCSCAVSEVGKTVFLTQEEAEAALEKMEEGK